MNHILLTGSNGFIGRSILKGSQGRLIRRLVRGHESHDSNTFNIPRLDRYSDFSGAFENIDAVVHLAALAHSSTFSDDEIMEVNYHATINLAKQAAAAGVKSFIFISSIGVNCQYTLKPISEQSTTNPNNLYAKSKLLAENELLKLKSQIDIIIIRPPLVYGEGAPGNFASLVKLIKLLPILPICKENNFKSFISIHNLIDFIFFCLDSDNVKSEIYMISDDRDCSTKSFMKAIAKGLGVRRIFIPLSNYIFKFICRLTNKEKIYIQLCMDLQISIDKVKKQLKWIPNKNSMEQTMSKLKKEK